MKNFIIQEKKVSTLVQELYDFWEMLILTFKEINKPNTKFSYKHKNKLKESEIQLYSLSESLMWHQNLISELEKENFVNRGMTEHKANVCVSGICHGCSSGRKADNSKASSFL